MRFGLVSYALIIVSLARAVCGMLSKEELPAFFEGLWKKVIRPESEKEVSDEEYVF